MATSEDKNSSRARAVVNVLGAGICELFADKAGALRSCGPRDCSGHRLYPGLEGGDGDTLVVSVDCPEQLRIENEGDPSVASGSECPEETDIGDPG